MIELSQGASYELRFPIVGDDGSPVTVVENADFTLYRGRTVAYNASLCNSLLQWDVSAAVIPLNDTTSYKGVYTFELWILKDGLKHVMRTGSYNFNVTNTRIALCP